MKAEDTVIDSNVRCDCIGHCYHCQAELVKQQAEISFKAGIKEVVEWIEYHSQNIYSNDTRESYVQALNKKEWQSKLKEWGIDG